MKLFLKKMRNYIRIFTIEIKQCKLNCKYVGFIKYNDSTIRWRLLLLSHSLEKGFLLCDSRINFGYKKAVDLFDLVKVAKKNKLDNKFEYQEAISALSKYKEYRENKKLECEFLSDLENYTSDCDIKCQFGVKQLPKEELMFKESNVFYKLCIKRHSVREYSDSYVSEDIIIKAIDLARLSPSACNRQMNKVFFSSDIQINKKLSEFIPGNSGTKDEKSIFLFICSDTTAFDFFELYQWYLNGGIFAAYLSLALTSLNVGNCIYQWPISYKSNKSVRKLLEIPVNFEITTVISVGNYRDVVNVLNSERKSVNEYFILR